MWPCGTIVNHAPSQSSEMASEERAETLADESREQSGENIQEHLYKVLVIGDFGVGKTSVIRRYTEDVFSPNYKLTIGVDFSLKTLQWDPKTKINLQLWDIAGHERFGSMTRVYYKYAIAAIIVFDLTRQVTFDSVVKWLGDVNQKVVLETGEPVPILLLANKCDIDNPQVDVSVVDGFCSKHNIAGWYSTSAKEGTNITEAMEFLVGKILELSTKEPEGPLDAIDLGGTSTAFSNTVESTDSPASNGRGYSTTKMNGLVGVVENGSHNHSEVSRPASNSCAC